MRRLVKSTLVVATVLSLSACSLFDKDASNKVSSTVVPHSGLTQQETVSVESNTLKWADYSAKLPRTFPEIKVNGSSNFNNFISEQGITSVTWTNTSADNMKEMISFVEGELGCTFEEDGDIMTAREVEISGSKYNISFSSTEGDTELVSMTISSAN